MVDTSPVYVLCQHCGELLIQPHNYTEPICDDCYDAMAHFHSPTMRQRADGTIYNLLDKPDAIRPEQV